MASKMGPVLATEGKLHQTKTTRVVKQEVANVPTNKTKANKDPAMAVMASILAVGETDSTETTAAVVGITKAAA